MEALSDHLQDVATTNVLFASPAACDEEEAGRADRQRSFRPRVLQALPMEFRHGGAKQLVANLAGRQRGLMTGEGRTCVTHGPITVGARRSRDAIMASVLGLGLIMVFLLSLAHDEIVEALVAENWLRAAAAERAEIVLGLGLFVIWGVLTVALVDLFRRSASLSRDE